VPLDFCYTVLVSETTTELKEGDTAPDFNLKDDAGKSVKLSDFKGKNVVLYFYPADDTPGCTKEACAFNENVKVFARKDTVILGVSPDNEASHVKFKQKYSLTFPLLVDNERKIATAYGAFGRKVLYGKESFGIIRSTFVIGPDGRLKKAFRHVRVDGHTDQVLEALS